MACSSAASRRHRERPPWRDRDIVPRGGQRKSQFLFSFPGLLAPLASGGRIRELADLGTKNPAMYLDFPQGRLKLFGTHKNKYLTLQMTRYTELSSAGDSSESDNEIGVADAVHDKMTSPAAKNESQSEDG